jgi:hypothetical protein
MALLDIPPPGPILPMTAMERVLQWVFGEQRCRMPWRVDPSICFDGGLTAKPRRRAPGGWATAEASAGMKAGRNSVTIGKKLDPQAGVVLDAVKRLPPRQAALVITHGRKCSRPDEMRDKHPRLVPVLVTRKGEMVSKIMGRNKHGHYGYCPLVWDVSPFLVADARQAGRLWREAVARLERELDGLTINGWAIRSEQSEAA